MPKNNSEQKEKPLAGILKMACGSKMALFLFAVTLIFLKLLLQMKNSEQRLSCCCRESAKGILGNKVLWLQSVEPNRYFRESNKALRLSAQAIGRAGDIDERKGIPG